MIEDLKKELKSLADEKYQKFSSSLLPNVDNILGVRLPQLRKIAKRIAKNNYIDFFKQNNNEFMELTMLEGMVIGYLPISEQEKYIKNFIPKINNWAVCDSFCSGLKLYFNRHSELPRICEVHRAKILDTVYISKSFLEPYFKSSKEYEIRFAFVILLNYFIDSNYNYVIQKISEFNNEAYYAKMAVAWCLSICIVKNYNQAINDIQTLKIQPWALKKGITKAIESLRLTKEQKDKLKLIRNSK